MWCDSQRRSPEKFQLPAVVKAYELHAIKKRIVIEKK